MAAPQLVLSEGAWRPQQTACVDHGTASVVLSYEELRRLEKRFGPQVMHMGCWNSDGVFGYASIPVSAIEVAMEEVAMEDVVTPELCKAFAATRDCRLFLELIDTCGARLIDKLVAIGRAGAANTPFGK